MDLQEIYKALRSEYNGKTWSDEFLPTHIDLRGDQIICWFEIDEDEGDDGFEEKRDCAISFYDEVVRFLVDNFGEEFKYEDPRISDSYIDKNNIHGQYEIVLDDDGESPAVIAIWENEENEMKPRFNENKKLVKEGAGAGYTVGISDLEIGEVTEVKPLDDGDYSFTATIKPGNYEISADSYYDDFFWQEHEFGDTPEAKIDGGAIHGTICPWEDTDDPEEWVRYHVEGHTFNLSFMYGAGWMHVNLPEDGQLYIDEHIKITTELYFSVDDIQLDAIDLVQAVNCGYASLDDRYNDEEGEGDKDEEPVNEVSGWKLEDEDLTLVNSESDGDKLYIVKLWWGSGYMTDNYNAYAFNEEEALNYVVSYIEKNDPETLEAADECAKNLLNEIEQDHISATEMGYDDDFYPEDTPEFQEAFLWVDATTEGAKKPHYIWAENLQIAEYPKEHDYPMAKGARRMDESYDEGWASVGAAFNEFTQRLWSYTRKDRDNRIDDFQKCTKTCEQAMRDYFNEVVL